LQAELSGILDDFELLTSQFIDHESFRSTLEGQVDALRAQCHALQTELAEEKVRDALNGIGSGGRVRAKSEVIAARGFDGSGGHINAFDMVALVRNGQGKAALITEAVEHFARRIVACGTVIFALIEKRAGLLAPLEIVNKGDAVFLGQYFVRDFSMENTDALVESFEQTYFRIVSLENALGRKKFEENFDEQALVAFCSLAECLYDQVISIAVHNQRRQLIRFAVNQAIGVRIVDNETTIGGCPADSFCEKSAINRRFIAREQADGDLGFIAVEGAAVETAPVIGEADDSASVGRRGAYVAAINP